MAGSSDMLSLDSVFITNPNLVLRVEAGEGAILFDADTGAVRILNETAAAIWRLVDGKRTLSEVLACLQQEYDGMTADAGEQVLKLAQDFYRAGAVKRAEGPVE